jgi:hypothetical protein
MEQPLTPSAVAWSWRPAGLPGDDDARRRSRDAARTAANAAARKKGVLGAVLGLAVAAVFYYFGKTTVAMVVAAVAIVLALLAFVAPAAHRRVTGWLDRFAHVFSLAVTWILMTILYYLLFLPVGLFLRARGRLGITKHPDRRLPSYWSSIEGRPWTAESYRKQF